MKRFVFAISLLLISGALFAFCGSGKFVGNGGANYAITGLDVNPANVTAFCWIQGSADFAVNGTLATSVADGTCTAGGTTGGCDSDGVPSVDQTGTNAVLFDDGSAAGNYYVYSDWMYTGYDGCPGPSTTLRACVLAYDTAGNVYYGSKAQAGSGWGGWDDLGAVAATPCSIPTGVVMQNGGTTTVDVTWDNTAAGLYGSYAAGDAPASPLLTTFDVWFYQDTNPPTSFTVPGTGWTAGTTGIATSTATTTGMTIPWTAGQYTYMTRRFYAEGKALPMASSNYTTVAIPSGAPAITAVSATHSGLTTTVNWTSGDESQVTGYQVFWAPQGGEFTAVGSQVSPAGNDHNYTASVRIPSTTTFSVKVGAFKTNGEVEYSAATLVKSANVIKDKTRATVN